MGSHRWQVVPRHGFHADGDGRERVRCSNERQHTVRALLRSATRQGWSKGSDDAVTS